MRASTTSGKEVKYQFTAHIAIQEYTKISFEEKEKIYLQRKNFNITEIAKEFCQEIYILARQSDVHWYNFAKRILGKVLFSLIENYHLKKLTTPQVLAFDLDLTIHDAIKHYNYSVSQTIIHFGGVALNKEQLNKLGENYFVSSRNIFAYFLSEELADEALQYYFNHFLKNEIPKEAVIPGARELLSLLNKNFKIPVVAVTNADEHIAIKILQDLNLYNLFDYIIGIKKGIPYKPNPTMLLMALNQIQLNPGPHVWFVGDMPSDVTCAKLINCTAIRFYSGLKKPLDKEADLIINSHHYLLKIITSKLKSV